MRQRLGPALADAMKGGAIVHAMRAGVLVWSCQPDFCRSHWLSPVVVGKSRALGSYGV